MAQGEFWVERQNWARWPKVIMVNRVTESGTQMRRYVRKPSDFGESHEYALQKIAELKDENAKLREQIHWLKKGDILHILTDQEYFDQCERERLMQETIDAYDDENTKLRDLVRDIWDAYRCEEAAPNVAKHWHDRMRELGIEVNA